MNKHWKDKCRANIQTSARSFIFQHEKIIFLNNNSILLKIVLV